MTLLSEVIIDWQVGSAQDGVSVLYFADQTDMGPALDGVFDWLLSLQPSLMSSTRAEPRNNGRVINDATGDLAGIWTAPAVGGLVGDASGQAVQNASQVLLRFETATIANNRVVKGRLFIPGLSSSVSASGEVSGAYMVDIPAQAEATLGDDIGHSVWHRPGPSGPGLSCPVVSYGCWNEFAVLRRRR
uniref:Uncharacterized protein n=1 Tax=uncultured prokaryote TaxID=198431 RepID=A0A0H5Q7V6_9ZZZZ|nr:hypothetical protein [uncultured prokaryote]